MPIITPKGLQGLRGISSLSDNEYEAFVSNNRNLIAKHNYDPKYISNLYSNKQFINAFGRDAFHQAKANGFDLNARNELLRDKIVTNEFKNLYSPFNEDGTRNNKKGLGADFEKYFGQIDPATGQRVGGISTDGLLRILESDYLTPEEFESDWNKKKEAALKNDDMTAAFRPAGSVLNPALAQYDEANKKLATDRNNRILEHIYNDEADNAANRLSDQVSAAYADPALTGLSDEQVRAAFKQAITPSKTNMGIPEYASHYGVVEGDISSEMKNFSIDEMREVLAKKAAYDQYLSPDMAMTALNNDAKRYIHNHQGFGKKAELFAKDVLIASSSYTADKINGFYNMGLMTADAFGDKPVVWVDANGNVVDQNKNKLFKNNRGDVYYYDENGNKIAAHQEQIARTTLYNMGRNMDGTENTSWLNPQDWTRREQFGVWDKDLAKQYEKLGSSPYKVAYNPNDDRDLLYESFKMMSFGLADAGAQLIPFGIGAAGKALSTANNVGRVVRGLGKGINTASKFLVAGEGVPGNIGATVQGLSGAVGIAEAYQRGAFQETLAQNMANLEQATVDKSKNDIYNQYNNDAEYKKNIDALINARANTMKAEYMASLGEEGRKGILDEKKIDEMIRARAQEAVLGEMIQNKVDEYKNSNEYAAMQERAINSAGLAATNSFWPEAIKYGLVNTIGFRKYLYTTPTSVTQKAINNFKGLREITTSAGRKRLATDIGKTLTSKEKWKNFGKVAGGQIWGGAWTNGTDDMMVDAAERINEDSFSRYLHDYETGESTADTYGFADGIWSYWKGLNNSLGQDTTWEAAAVGGLGSTISGNLHFTNIASLFTKEGKEAYKNNFLQRLERDDDGMIVRDEQGNPITQKIGWRENWRDRLAFFVQNGVLNTYYGKKQEMRNLQEHADFINNILDDMDDFKGIESLISSDIGRENAINIGDEKTMRFVQAFNAIHTLENLGKDEKDPSTLSSVVMQHKDLIERASKLGTNEADMSEEEITNLLGQYYSNNPGLAQTEENNQIILQNIAQNAKKLKEAYEAYNKAEENIQVLEKEKGAPIVAPVRFRMKLSQALDEHWKERLETMREEIGDASSSEPTTGEALIAAVGGKRKADSILKSYGIQEATLLEGVNQAISEQQKKLDVYNKVQNELREAEESGDSNAILLAQVRLKEAKDNYDEAVEDRMYREDMLSASRDKRDRLQEAVDAWEKGTKSKVLKADDIMSLDPVTRAMMLQDLREGESDPYSPAQRKQIEKLKAQLKNFDKTGDPLQKIQDIALLTQRIAQNEDAYHRLSRNPDAAAAQLEKQQKVAAEKAYNLINERNAETLANYVIETERALKGFGNSNKKNLENFVYQTLRTKSLTLLNLIEKNNLLPQYVTQIQDAKDWAKITSDIDSVIDSSDKEQAWKDNISRNIEFIIQNADNKEDIIANLEKVIDDVDSPQVAQDFDTILKGLENLGYQRDATVVENRKQRKEREEAAKKKLEEEKAKVEKAAEEARAKAEEEAVAKAQEEAAKSNPTPSASSEVAVEKAQEEAQKQAEGAKPLADNDASEGKPVLIPDIDAEKEAAAHAPNEDEEIDDGEVVWNLGAERMEDDAEDGSVSLGEMWSGTPQNPQKGVFVVNRETKNGKPVITFGLQQSGFDVLKPETLTVAPEDYEAAAKQQPTEQGGKISEPIDVLVAWAEGRISGEDAIKQLDGTEYVKHTKGNPGLGTKDSVHFSNKVEWELGKYLTNKYPFLTYGNVSVATGVSTFGGNMNLTVVRDAEGNEYGTPSNFLRSLATNPDGRAAEAVKKGLEDGYKGTQQEGKPEGEPSGTVAEEKRDFNVKSIEKKDDGWYFNGTFAGQKEETQVKASNSFDLDEAVDRQKTAREAMFAAQGVTTDTTHLEDAGDDVQGKSLSLEEQVANTAMRDKIKVEETNTLEDAASTNNTEEHGENSRPSTLSGSAVPEWVRDKDSENRNNQRKGNPVRYEQDLVSDGVLVHRKGGKDNDNMNKFFAWMDAAGIKLQNIIDRELGEILRKNPDLKVKFMAVRPESNATKDSDVKTSLFLVLDYDNKINKGITSIHDDANGGVITSNGKKYLVIGTVGDFGNESKRQLRDILFTNNPSEGSKLGIGGSHFGLVKQGSGEFFRAHPEERFWVPENLSTEIVPYSLIPGWIVNQLDEKDTREYRNVSELLRDRRRNPLGFNSLEDLGWIIQERTKFVAVGVDKSRVMRPADVERNAGSVFVMVPASNGKFIPSYIKPLFYREMNDGELKQTIDELLVNLTSPSYTQRYQAVVELSKIFHFDKEGKNILVGKDKSRHANQITLKDGEQSTTFMLDSSFDRIAFLQAFDSFNPRINITASVLMNPRSLRIYDEAGALQTDIAQLATAGSSYSIYALDTNGEIVKPSEAPMMPARVAESTFKEDGVSQIVYNGKYYRENYGAYYLNGVPVTDENLIKELQYNQRIANGELEAVETKGVWDSYLLGSKEHPEGIKVNKNTKKVKKMTEQEALDLYEKIEKEKARKEREAAAKSEKQKLDTQDGEIEMYEPEDIDMDFDDNTGDLIVRGEKKQKEAQRKKEESSAEEKPVEKDNAHKSETELENKKTGSTQSFSTLVKDKQYRKQIIGTIKAKWPDAPSKIAELEEFLKRKNVEIAAIGTDEASIKAWIDTVNDCR